MFVLWHAEKPASRRYGSDTFQNKLVEFPAYELGFGGDVTNGLGVRRAKDHYLGITCDQEKDLLCDR